MLSEYKTKTNLFIGIGLVLQIVAKYVIGGDIGSLGALIGGILVVIGCCYYAKAKGHNGAWGLLGLLSLIGLLILVAFKDKCKEQ